MDIRSIQYFLAIAKYLNLSKAAESLYLSQSALSQFLTKEEQELGVKLFLRSKNQLSLTYAGQLYKESCIKISEEQHMLYRKLADVADSKTGQIFLGITPQWGGELFAAVYPIFTQKFPNCLVKITESTKAPLINQLRDGKLDFAILPLSDQEKLSLPHHIICQEEMLLAVPRSFLPHSGKAYQSTIESVSLKLFSEYPFIISCIGTTIRELTNQMFEDEKIIPDIICEINNHSSTLKMAESGLGIAIVPRSYMRASDNICYYQIGKGYSWNICSVYRKNYFSCAYDQEMLHLIEIYYT